MRKLILILLFVSTLLNAQNLLFDNSKDIKPNQFTFTDVTGANLSTAYSTYIIVSGINKPTTVTANGASYKVGANGSVITTASTCVNGDTVYVYNTSSTYGLTATNLVLTVGTISDTYTVTTVQGFIASVNTTNNPSIVVRGTGSLFVDWGDGSNDTYTLTSSDQTISHTYSSAINTSIKFNGNITKFSTSSNMAWSFDLDKLTNLSALTYFSVAGSNTITGNLSSISSLSALYYFKVSGSNTITGNLSSISSLSVLNTFYVDGSNTITGNLSSLSSLSALTYFYVAGSNTITGNLSSISSLSALTYFTVSGSNTITGNLSSLSSLSALYNFQVYGSNTITGNLSSISSLSALFYFYVAGSNTITGNLSSLSSLSALFYFYVAGSNTINDFTDGALSFNNINYFRVNATTSSLSSTEVDNLLIRLAALTWSGSTRAVLLNGGNAARTSASDAAVATLVSKSVTVTTN